MANDSTKSDELQLITDTLRGNSSAFRPLVEKHWGLVYSIIQKYIKDPETIADISQEAFLLAFTRLKQYRHEHRFSPWLAKIAVNKALEFLRREKRSPIVDFDPELAECYRFEPEQLSRKNEFFDECLEKLPTEMQIMFILRHGLEFSYDDIAHVLDLPVGTIKGALFRIRNQLKSIFSNGQLPMKKAMFCEGSECNEE